MKHFAGWAHNHISTTHFEKGSTKQNAEPPLQRLSLLKGAEEAQQRLVGQSALNPELFPAQSCVSRTERAIS